MIRKQSFLFVGLYVSLWLYPLSVRGSSDKGQWICQILLLLDGMLVSLLLLLSGMFSLVVLGVVAPVVDI